LVKNTESYRRGNPIKGRALIAINNHKHRGYDVRITTDELVELYKATTHCPICGIELCHAYGSKGQRDNAASIDRKENSKVMTKENIWIICQRCNTMKGNQTMKEYYHRSLMIVKKFKEEFS